MSDEFRDLGRNADRSFDKARRSADRLEDSLSDVEDEANQSAKEFGASFRGDPVEALEEVQSYIAELVSIRLPGLVGALAGIAGGAALGLIVSQIDKWRERQEEIKQQASDLLNTYRDFESPILDARAGMRKLVEETKLNEFWSELTTEEYVKLLGTLQRLGIDQDQLNRLIADGTDGTYEWGKRIRDAGGGYDGMYQDLLFIDRLTEDQAQAWRGVGRAVEADARYQVQRLADDIRNLPAVDLQISQGTLNRLATMEQRLNG